MKHGPAKSVRARVEVAVVAAAMAEAAAVVVVGEGAETDANIAGKPQPVFRFFSGRGLCSAPFSFAGTGAVVTLPCSRSEQGLGVRSPSCSLSNSPNADSRQ